MIFEKNCLVQRVNTGFQGPNTQKAWKLEVVFSRVVKSAFYSTNMEFFFHQVLGLVLGLVTKARFRDNHQEVRYFRA